MKKFESTVMFLLILSFVVASFPEISVARTYSYIYIEEDGNVNPTMLRFNEVGTYTS